jgi:hypothetical protein
MCTQGTNVAEPMGTGGYHGWLAALRRYLLLTGVLNLAWETAFSGKSPVNLIS